MKRIIFMIVAAGSALTAFLFFQPVSNDDGGLISPPTLASPVASASEQPVAFTSAGATAQSTTTSGSSAQPVAVPSKAVTKNLITNSPALKTKSSTTGTAVNSPQSITGAPSIQGGDEDEDDEDDEDEEDDD